MTNALLRIWECDRCGCKAALDSDAHGTMIRPDDWTIVSRMRPDPTETSPTRLRSDLDLCGPCTRDLARWLQTPPEQTLRG